MAKPVSGGCACGAVTYRVSADPVLMLNCHCRDCQRATGSAFAPVVVVPRAAVHFDGELRYHRIVGEDRYAVERGFCAGCGSPVANTLERHPELLCVMAASLDDPSMHRPTVDIYTASAQPWDHLPPDTQKFERGLTK